jgi:branched-chain amino acid transport system substrate-binding protein
MKNKFTFLVIIVLLVSMVPLFAGGDKEKVIKIGFNIPMTGDIPKVGEASKFAAEMMKEDINSAGGLEIGGVKYMVEFIYQDNESKAESAVAVALKLIEQDKVIGIIGPNSSKQAIPGGEVADDNRTPMVSPWSTNPATTKDRPYVFRAAFLDPFQGPVAAAFATEQFGAKTAAVMYNLDNDYSKGLAEYFTAAFEKLHGKGSVIKYESFGQKDQDFSVQLTKIIAAKPDFMFLPIYYNKVALVLPQASDLGWDGKVLGSDSWGSAELVTLGGDYVKGHFFITHYAAAGAKGATKAFIDRYNKEYGYIPDDVGALSWDALGVMIQGLKGMKELTGDIAADRVALMESIKAIKSFAGVTGTMAFDSEGDPIKEAVIVKVSDSGEFVFEKAVAP